MNDLHDPSVVTRLARGVAPLLTGWGMPADSRVTLLAMSENVTFRVDDARTGRALALRVHRPGYHTRAEILSELAWIEALRADDVFRTVTPLPRLDDELIASLDDTGGHRDVVAFDFVSGHEPRPGDALAEDFRTLGAISARLHRHARQWTRPDGFVRKVWNTDTIVGATAHWGPWQDAIGLDPAGHAALAHAVRLLGERLHRFGTGSERFGLIHADLRLANLLDNDGDLTVIDFDDCGFGWFLFDLAAALSFIEEEPCVPALIAAWLAGYRDVARCHRRTKRWFPR